jgi:hypothetical protein
MNYLPIQLEMLLQSLMDQNPLQLRRTREDPVIYKH